ncbi:TPA: hypothetical protein EYP66_18520, partial [Candidatus Poribacteria bacterium]|nr:hypothetical protein [Candidatus Poribacteria bacterium]
MAQTCKICGKWLKNKRALIEHVKKNHAEQSLTNSSEFEQSKQMEEAKHIQSHPISSVGIRSIPKDRKIEEFLEFIHTEGWLEIRLIGNKSIPRFYNSVNEILNDLESLKTHNESGFNIYYGILPRKSKPESGGGNKEHVIDNADRLWLDIDVFSVKRPEKYSNLTNEEIKAKVMEKYEEAKRILESSGIHITACVYSGRGFQPIIKLNQKILKEEIEELNRVLIRFLRGHGFKVDNAWDCARILRLPGFYNVKDERKLLAELIELNDKTTDVENVKKLAELFTVEKEAKSTEIKSDVFVNDLGIHLDAIRMVDRKLDELLTVVEHADYPSLSEADMACASRLYYWRFNESQIIEILRNYRYREKLDRDDYINLTLSKINGDRFNPAKNPSLFLKLVKITEDLRKGSMSRFSGKHFKKEGCFNRDVQDVHVLSYFNSISQSILKEYNNLDDVDDMDISKENTSFLDYEEENLDIDIKFNVEYFFNRNKFVAKRLADVIMNQFVFITLNDSEEVLFYNNGVFRPGGESIIKHYCEKYLGEEANNHRVNEVIGHIWRLTYIDRSKFDNNKNLIAVENGVLDLETMELYPHSPKYLLTVKLHVKYDPEADCPEIKKFFSEVLHQDDIPVIEELFGYCLYRDYFIQKAFMFVGEGNNGKSTLISLLREFLGKANVSSKSLQELVEDRFATSELYGKMANLFADIPDKALKNTGIFKMLTGGDMLEAQRKFQHPFKFVNYAKLIFSANKLPETYDETDAFFRRWIIINFPNKFEGDKADKKLIEKLTKPEELSGLLNLALAGLKRLLEKGDFSGSKSTDEIREEYIRMSDPVGAFVLDCVEVASEEWVSKDDFYNSFCEYCRRNKLPTVPKNKIAEKLQRHIKVEDYRPEIEGKRIRAWKGIRLVDIGNGSVQSLTNFDSKEETDSSKDSKEENNRNSSKPIDFKILKDARACELCGKNGANAKVIFNNGSKICHLTCAFAKYPELKNKWSEIIKSKRFDLIDLEEESNRMLECPCGFSTSSKAEFT